MLNGYSLNGNDSIVLDRSPVEDGANSSELMMSVAALKPDSGRNEPFSFFLQVKFTNHVSSQLNPGAVVAVPADGGGLVSLKGQREPVRRGDAGRPSSEYVSEMDSRWLWFVHWLFGTC